MNLLKELITRTQCDIDQVTEMFYQGKNQIGFEKLINIIDEITNIIVLLEKSQVDLTSVNTHLLQSNLKDATDAMISNDTVLLADILRYDIKDYLNKVLDQINEGRI